MAFYKEINDMPFRDFTLSEFIRWRDIFSVFKKRDKLSKETLTFEEAIQIVYYHLAIENYGVAIKFLNNCDQTNNHIIFLKLLLYFTETDQWDIYSTDQWDIYSFGKARCEIFNTHHRNLLDLGLIQYPPALRKIGKGHYIPTLIDDEFGIKFRKDLLNDLIQIKQNCAEQQIDEYYTNLIDKRIADIVDHQDSEDMMQPWFSNPSPEELLKLAINGSEAATLIVIYSWPIKNYIAKQRPEDSDLLSLRIISKTSTKKLCNNKIQQLNISFIASILSLFRGRDIEKINELDVDSPLSLIMKCLDQAYRYLCKGGDNAGLIISYLEYFVKVGISLPERYKSICESLLLDACYKSGFLILPILRHKNRINIYANSFANSLQPISKDVIPTINELVENFFWYRDPEDSNLNVTTHPYVNVIKEDDKIIYFCSLITLSPDLWQPSCCILGINLFAEPTYKTHDDILEGILMIGKMRKLLHQHMYYLTIPVINLLKSLDDLVTEYKNIFHEEIDMIKLNEIHQKYDNILQKANDRTLEIGFVIRAILEISEFCQSYTANLKEHFKYQPNGVGYNDVAEDFYSRAKTNN